MHASPTSEFTRTTRATVSGTMPPLVETPRVQSKSTPVSRGTSGVYSYVAAMVQEKVKEDGVKEIKRTMMLDGKVTQKVVE